MSTVTKTILGDCADSFLEMASYASAYFIDEDVWENIKNDILQMDFTGKLGDRSVHQGRCSLGNL